MNTNTKTNNPLNSIVNNWAFFLIFLIIISPIKLDLLEFILPFLLLIIFTLLLNLGEKITLNVPARQYRLNFHPSNKFTFLLIISLTSIAGSFYSGYFFTGTLPTELIDIISKSMSAYNKFQNYGIDNDLTSFNISQALPFFFTIFTRVWGFYILYICIIRRLYAGTKKFTLIILSSFAFMYFGMVRGTTLEFFEYAIFIFLCKNYEKRIWPSANKNKSKSAISTILIVIFSFSIFYYNQLARAESQSLTECISNELCFNENSIMHDQDNIISILIFKLNGYFSFGIFFLSKYITKILTSDWGAVSAIIPTHIVSPDTAKKMICGNVIDCRAAWTPDIIALLENFGLPLSLFFITILGSMSRLAHTIFIKYLYFDYFLVCFYIIFQIMSLFVGNFIVINQTSQAILLMAIASMSFRMFKTRFTKQGK